MRSGPGHCELVAIDFRPLAESDLPRLAGWLKADHVQEWWRDPSEFERVQAKYLPRIHDEEPTEVFVITLGAEDIGVIQRYRLSDFPAWDGTVAGTGLAFEHSAGIDYLIGERVHLGRGLGTQSIEQFTDRLFADWSDIEEVVVTPQAANRPSCRALEKAGYALRWTGRLDSDDPADSGVTALYTRRR